MFKIILNDLYNYSDDLDFIFEEAIMVRKPAYEGLCPLCRSLLTPFLEPSNIMYKSNFIVKINKFYVYLICSHLCLLCLCILTVSCRLSPYFVG